MSVRIRLSRAGKVKRAFFHIVVADSSSPRDGKIIEKIGYYDPVSNPAKVEVKSDRALYWLSKGAEPTRIVYQLLKKKGIMKLVKNKSAESQVSPSSGMPAPEEEKKA